MKKEFFEQPPKIEGEKDEKEREAKLISILDHSPRFESYKDENIPDIDEKIIVTFLKNPENPENFEKKQFTLRQMGFEEANDYHDYTLHTDVVPSAFAQINFLIYEKQRSFPTSLTFESFTFEKLGEDGEKRKISEQIIFTQKELENAFLQMEKKAKKESEEIFQTLSKYPDYVLEALFDKLSYSIYFKNSFNSEEWAKNICGERRF